MGRQNIPREQWLEIGAECPHCGERVYEKDVSVWRPDPEDPRLVMLYCPDCGDRVEISHV